MAPMKVALAGATGNVGVPILKALAKSPYDVTVLSRKGGNSSSVPSYPNVSVVEVEYADIDSLKAALESHEVVVSTISSAIPAGQNTVIDPKAKKNEAVRGSQDALIEAAFQVGVQRFIPSEFGSNTSHPLTATLPVFANKVAARKNLQERSEQKPSFTWTAVHNGAFLDWGLINRTFINVPEHKVDLYDEGDVPFSTTSMNDVGRAIVGIIENQAATANRVVYIQSALITQNQIIKMTKEMDGKEWHIKNHGTQFTRNKSFKALEAGHEDDIGPAMLGFVASAIFGSDCGNDYSKHLDNELLGITQLNDEEIKALVRSVL